MSRDSQAMSGQPDEREDLNLLDDAREFLSELGLVLLAAAGAMLLAYGFAVTTFSISIDEQTRFLEDRACI